ncbi:MAG: hypothetical protein JJU16_03445 [Alkalibacterium sp.]|nr:hypothetical protein [Alkalibacterium sp.]
MKNIPTKEELIGYIKSDKKTIGQTVAVFIILFILLLAYSLYSNFTDMREEEELFLSQEEIVEILDREPEEVSAADIRNIEEALEQERYSFGVLIERDDQTFYNYPALITEFLISEEVVAFVEERVGTEILPSAELAVEVSEDSSTRILEVVIGTADEDDNRIISQAYYEAIQEEGLIAPLDDKTIYMMDDESFLIEEETWVDLVMAQIQFITPARAAVGFIIMTGLGLIAGVVLVLVKTMLRKEIPFMYELKVEESDKVLYYNQIRDVEPVERYSKLIHAVMSFPEKKKLVLAQYDLNQQFILLLEEKINERDESSIVLLNDVEETPVNLNIDEVIILIEQNKTTKNWYRNQRIQLERLGSVVTILTY